MNFAKTLFKKNVMMLVLVAVAAFGLATTLAKEDNKYFEISKNIEIFSNLYKEINTFYVDDLDPSNTMRIGIDAMLESLDPYTNYISESEIEGFKMLVKGRYSGIGATVNKMPGDEFPFITQPIKGFPAQKAGIKAGDILLEVDGQTTKDRSTDDVEQILRGATNSKVKLRLKNPVTEKEYDVTLTRTEVKIPNVPYSGMVDNEIGYINLTTFTQDAGKNVENALLDLKKNNKLKGVILDLRGNGGGLLIEAVNIVNIFTPKNELIVSTRGKIKDRDKNFGTLNTPADLDIPLVVLIDEGSASASEIVSGALQDLDRAVLIGQKSFGKGLVQNTRDVGFNARVKMTIAKYYIPSGRCIQAVSYKNGEPVEIPDSLKAVFKTKNGRPVLDGGGIMPDVKMPAPKGKNVIRALNRQNIIFDFATLYAGKHDAIGDVQSFQITDGDFDDFVKFANSKEFVYNSKTELYIKNLEKKAKEEKYYDVIKNDLANLKQKFTQEKINILRRYKPAIKDLIEREIASRYFFERGRVEVGLANDDEVSEAIKVLKDGGRMTNILSGQ
jgi:carboxyl-terminal processing protease